METGKFGPTPLMWGERTCSTPEHLLSLDCGVDDEHHLIFDCEAFSDIRKEYDISVDCFKFIVRCMRTLDQEEADDCAEQP